MSKGDHHKSQMAKRNSLLMAVLLLLFSCSSSAHSYSGTIGFTDSPYYRTCTGINPENNMVAAVPESLYKGGKGCRTKYQITCIDSTADACVSSKPITVTVSGVCDACPTFVLSKEVYIAIANIDAKSVKVSYKRA
ncbi:EXPB5 [Linum perenne]